MHSCTSSCRDRRCFTSLRTHPIPPLQHHLVGAAPRECGSNLAGTWLSLCRGGAVCMIFACNRLFGSLGKVRGAAHRAGSTDTGPRHCRCERVFLASGTGAPVLCAFSHTVRYQWIPRGARHARELALCGNATDIIRPYELVPREQGVGPCNPQGNPITNNLSD